MAISAKQQADADSPTYATRRRRRRRTDVRRKEETQNVKDGGEEDHVCINRDVIKFSSFVVWDRARERERVRDEAILAARPAQARERRPHRPQGRLRSHLLRLLSEELHPGVHPIHIKGMIPQKKPWIFNIFCCSFIQGVSSGYKWT